MKVWSGCKEVKMSRRIPVCRLCFAMAVDVTCKGGGLTLIPRIGERRQKVVEGQIWVKEFLVCHLRSCLC